ncbi:MAG TPA: hypothetical protein VKV27_07330 [Solirubrobacteraceae bacterium]|nr:hypothetical protein [Solirubrobacteraceae bacterium]
MSSEPTSRLAPEPPTEPHSATGPEPPAEADAPTERQPPVAPDAPMQPQPPVDHDVPTERRPPLEPPPDSGPQAQGLAASVARLREQRPEVAVGAAFAGGLLLATILRRLAR